MGARANFKVLDHTIPLEKETKIPTKINKKICFIVADLFYKPFKIKTQAHQECFQKKLKTIYVQTTGQR